MNMCASLSTDIPVTRRRKEDIPPNRARRWHKGRRGPKVLVAGSENAEHRTERAAVVWCVARAPLGLPSRTERLLGDFRPRKKSGCKKGCKNNARAADLARWDRQCYYNVHRNYVTSWVGASLRSLCVVKFRAPTDENP